RSRHCRRTAFRRGNGSRLRGHRGGRSPPGPGNRREDAVFQPRAKNRSGAVTIMAPGTKIPSSGAPDSVEQELCRLMQAYLEGHIDAFDALYGALASRIRGYLLALCRDATLADDLTQDTFLQVHRSRRTYEPGRPVTPWVFAIARHVYLMNGRATGRRLRFEEALTADARSDHSAYDAAQSLVTADEVHGALK